MAAHSSDEGAGLGHPRVLSRQADRVHGQPPTRYVCQCSPAYAVSLTISRGRFGGGGLWPDSGVHTLQVRVNHDSFDGVVAQLKPDFVIFDRFLMVRSQPSSTESEAVRSVEP